MTQIIDPTLVTTDARHTLNDLGFANGKGYVYLRADGAAVVGSVCIIDDGEAVPVTTTNYATHDGAGLCVAQQAVADNSYSWYQVWGKGTARMTDAVAVGVGLHTTGEAGELDDADSAGNVHGIFTLAATTGEATTSCMFAFPSVSSE